MLMIDDIRISYKKVLEDAILKIYKKYKWFPKFKVIEDHQFRCFLIKFRIGLTDFMARCPINFKSEADLMRINFFALGFEEEFKKCEEKAKARLAFDGDEILKERAWKIAINDRNRRIEQFNKLLADEKKHKRFLRKKFVEKIMKIIA